MSKLRNHLIIVITSAVLIAIAIKDVSSAAPTIRRPKNEQGNGQNCTNHLQTIDKCSSMATYSYTATTNPYPLTTIELKTSCDRINEGLKCIKIHGKCLSSIARRSLQAYSSSRSKHSKKLCANVQDPRSAEFLESAKCIRTKNKNSLMVAHEKELISTIQLLALNTTMKWESRLHKACCSAADYKIKVLKDIGPECIKYTTVVEDMLDSLVGELLEQACPEANRLKEICLKVPIFEPVKNWKPVSMSSAALDLIVSLSDNPK